MPIAPRIVRINGTLPAIDDVALAAWSVDPGDGSRVARGTGSPATSVHVYEEPGSYSVRLVVTDTAGLADAVARRVDVAVDRPPIGVLSPGPASGVAPLPVTSR